MMSGRRSTVMSEQNLYEYSGNKIVYNEIREIYDQLELSYGTVQRILSGGRKARIARPWLSEPKRSSVLDCHRMRTPTGEVSCSSDRHKIQHPPPLAPPRWMYYRCTVLTIFPKTKM